MVDIWNKIYQGIWANLICKYLFYSHGTTVGKNQNQNRGQDPDHEVIPGPDPDQGVILTAVQADPDPGGLQDLEEDLEVDPDPIHQIYQSDEALHHFWKKEELQGTEIPVYQGSTVVLLHWYRPKLIDSSPFCP